MGLGANLSCLHQQVCLIRLMSRGLGASMSWIPPLQNQETALQSGCLLRKVLCSPLWLSIQVIGKQDHCFGSPFLGCSIQESEDIGG